MKELLIRQVPLFASLPAAELSSLAASLSTRNFKPGAVLFNEGEHGDRFYIILDGQVEIVKALGTDDERLIAVRGPGEFIGEMSLLNPDGLRTASARVRADAQTLELSRAEFDALLTRHPSLGYEMVRVLSLRLNASHNAAIRDLHEKNRQLTEANRQLIRAYEELKAAQAQIIEKEKLERELEVAHEIQQSILPRALPQLSGFDFGARMIPMRAVGGDFYDFIQLDNGMLGIAVGDVSDKGVPAAIFMALTCSLLRAEASRAASPAEALRSVNRHLLGMNNTGMFVTLLYGVLNHATHEFTYVRAGHELPVVFDARGELLKRKRAQGLALGLFPDVVLDEQSLSLPSGSTLIVHTDGITDAVNAKEARFGLEGLRTAARNAASASAQAVCDSTLQAVAEFAGAVPQFDDLTIVTIQSR